jgi:HEPN domain-containing protein
MLIVHNPIDLLNRLIDKEREREREIERDAIRVELHRERERVFEEYMNGLYRTVPLEAQVASLP